MAAKALTGRQIVIVLLCIVVFGGVVAALGAEEQPDPSTASRVTMISGCAVAALAVGTIIALAVGDYRASHRHDVEPDVLSSLVPADQLLQVGRCHLWITAKKREDRLRIVVLLQNLFDSENAVDLELDARNHGGLLQAPIPDMVVAIPPSAVVEAAIEVPLTITGSTRKLKFALKGKSRTVGGRQVRFRRRNAITQPVHPLVQIGGLLVGRLMWGGGTFLTATVAPAPVNASASPAASSGNWTFTTLWLPGEDAAVAATRIA